MKKRILALCLVFVLCLSCISSLVPDSSVQAADTVTYSIGDFQYASDQHVEKEYKELYYYSDSYFADSAFEYDASLATMSMCLSMAAFRSENNGKSYKNLQKLFKDCGFSEFSVNRAFKEDPTDNGVSFGCANKKIKVNGKSYTLIALAASGGGQLEAEWSGVFRVGSSGNLQNAEVGSVEILEFLEDYIEDKEISGNVKLWMTGYAAGAGKVNISAGKLDDGYELSDDITLKPEDRYTYCLQCPQVAKTSYGLTDSKYKNIFSVNNPYNITNHMAPTQYSLGRFGNLVSFPTKNSDSSYAQKRDKMLKQLNILSESVPYIIDDFHMKKISIIGEGMVADNTSNNDDQAQFIEKFIKILVKSCAPTRADYVNEYQDDFCRLVKVMLGTTDPKWQDCITIFLNAVQDDMLGCGINIVLGQEKNLQEKFYKHTKNAVEKAGVTRISDSDVKLFAEVLARLSVKFGGDNPDETVTLLYSMPSLMQGFYPPVNLAWMRSFDENYVGEGRDITRCKASLSKTSYDYSGSAKKPSVTVKNGDIKLTKGTDYTVSYKNNTNAGTATVTIKGIGLYSGTIKKTFKIHKIANTITASNLSKTYSKEKKTYRLDAEAKGDSKLTYKSNNEKIKVSSSGKVTVSAKYIGKATITITAAETKNYKKTTAKVTVTVKPPKVSLESVSAPKSKTLRIDWKKSSVASGYQIYYSKSKDFKTNTSKFTVKKSFDSIDITGLESKKTYYVKIRAYKTVDDKKIYSSWSAVKSKKTK